MDDAVVDDETVPAISDAGGDVVLLSNNSSELFVYGSM